MEISQQIRKEKYEGSAPHIQELYGDSDLGKLLRELATKNSIGENAYKNFALTVGDIILNLYPIEKLPELLAENVGLPFNVATEVTREVANFLEQFLQKTNVTATPKQKESPILQATRTMQSDMAGAGGAPQWRRLLDNEEGGTQAPTQEPKTTEENTGADVIPRYSKPLTDTPKYE